MSIVAAITIDGGNPNACERMTERPSTRMAASAAALSTLGHEPLLVFGTEAQAHRIHRGQHAKLPETRDKPDVSEDESQRVSEEETEIIVP